MKNLKRVPLPVRRAAVGARSHVSLPGLAPWRPTLASRFAGAMTGLDQHVLVSHDRGGFVTATIGASDMTGLDDIRVAAARAAHRIAGTCHCDVRGYRILVKAGARPLVVIDSRHP